MIGPYLFNFNETHIYNESWPPPAKFHDAQTMSSGVALSVATLLNLWRPGSGRVGLDEAALSVSVYWVSQLSAFFYPGTASVDPPAKDNWPQLRFTIRIPTLTRHHHFKEYFMTIAFWVVAGLNALMYLGFGGQKLARSQPALQAAGMGWTETVPPATIKLIGLAEILGAVGLILPIALGTAEILSPLAGACLTIIMAGAVITHRRRNEPSTFQLVLTAFALAATVLAAVIAL